jgi:hypothetical protein
MELGAVRTSGCLSLSISLRHAWQTQKKQLPGLEPVAFTITPESLENVQAVRTRMHLRS